MSFDPPAGSGRAALVVRVIWEVLLLAMAAVMLVLVLGKLSGPTSGISVMLTQFAVLGLPAAAIALSLRTATPNLAVGAIGGGAGLITVKLAGHGWSWWPAAGVGVAAALAVGVVAAVVIGLLDAPAWAVSFALMAGVFAAVLAVQSGGEVTVVPDGALPRDTGSMMDALAAVVVVGCVGGGVLWLLPGVRRAFGAPERLGARLAGALVGFGGSAAVAGLAGVAEVMYLRVSSPSSAFNLPLLPLAAALLGGASLGGRRGAIAGTVFATGLLVGVQQLLFLHNQPVWLSNYLPAAVAITVGIGVTSLLRVLEPTAVRTPDTAAPLARYPFAPASYTPPSPYAPAPDEFAPTQADAPTDVPTAGDEPRPW